MLFNYAAINKEGVVEKDQIEAGSYKEAVEILHKKSLIPTDIRQKNQIGSVAFFSQFSGVSLQDKILLVKNLSVLMKAGISLSRSLNILAKQTANAKLQKVLDEVAKKVESGKSFAEALQEHKNIFPNIFISMVRVGEVSGTLDKNLEYLAIQLQREHELVAKTKGALIYPAVVMFAVIIIGILMSIFVLPSLTAIFKDQQVQLPLTTRIVIAIVDFMSGHTLLALSIMAAIVFALVATFKTESGKNFSDRLIVSAPVIGPISRSINMARFSRVMSSMLKSGTPILEGLQVAADSMGNNEYKLAITAAVKDVRVGKSLASSLALHQKLFSYLVTQMVAVGEESGNVDGILEELAVHYEEEVDETMRNLSSIIEPVMILVIGAVVGVLALALISPIYSITQNAGG